MMIGDEDIGDTYTWEAWPIEKIERAKAWFGPDSQNWGRLWMLLEAGGTTTEVEGKVIHTLNDGRKIYD